VKYSFAPITDLMQQYRAGVAEECMADVIRLWARQYPGVVNEDTVRRQGDILLKELDVAREFRIP